MQETNLYRMVINDMISLTAESENELMDKFVEMARDDENFYSHSGIEVIRKDGWTKEPPKEGGTYWHWCGDFDYAPNVMRISRSGTTGKCFIQRGQLGFIHSIDCDEYGGWWMKLEEPPPPKI